MRRSPKARSFIAVGMLFYLGLGILGWGGFGPFFSNPARIAVAVAILVMCAAGMIGPENLSRGNRTDRAERWILVPLTMIGLLTGYLPAYSDRSDLWILDGDTLRWCGIVLFAAGGLLRFWPVFVLGGRFSGFVAIQPGHLLVTGGIYGLIRHPSYLGFLVNALGWVLVFRSGIGLLLVALTVPLLLIRIRSEEALLSAHFGQEYEAYRSRTARLIPGLY